jgi:hypothetical protein
MEQRLTLSLGRCADCHQETRLLAPTTGDCACLVCEQCALAAMDNKRRGVCGAPLTFGTEP